MSWKKLAALIFSTLIGRSSFALEFIPPSPCVIPFSQASTYLIQNLPNGEILVAGRNGVSKLDKEHKTLNKLPFKNSTGDIYAAQYSPKHGLFMASIDGFFTLDETASEVILAGNISKLENPTISGTADSLNRELDSFSFFMEFYKAPPKVVGLLYADNGGLLFATETDLFKFDPADRKIEKIRIPAQGKFLSLIQSSPIESIIVNSNGLLVYNSASNQSYPLHGKNIEEIKKARMISPDLILFGSEKNSAILDVNTKIIYALPGSESAFSAHQLINRTILFGTESGWSLFDPTTQEILEIEKLFNKQNIEQKPSYADLPNGDVLIGLNDGLFFYDFKKEKILLLDDTPGKVNSIVKVGDGWFLIAGEHGWYNFKKNLPLVPAGSIKTNTITTSYDVDRLGTLIGTDEGLLLAPTAPIAGGKTELDGSADGITPSPHRVELRFNVSDICSLVNSNMNLVANTFLDGEAQQSEPLRIISTVQRDPLSTSKFAAAIAFDKPGNWTLQIAQKINSTTSIPIGAPIPLRVLPFSDSLADQITRSLEFIAKYSLLAYTLLFLFLLLMCRSHSWAANALADSIWSKVFQWPLLLTRHVPAIQIWMLELYFQSMRETVKKEPNFLDSPIFPKENGLRSYGAGLLSRLKESRRIWLQGNSGMGKTSLYRHWEEVYFTSTGISSLTKAIRHFGFVLVTIPIRDYASLAIDKNHPENWIIEIVRLRLEQHGIGFGNVEFIKSLLNSGKFALVIDGANEADCEDSITSFSRQFPRSMLLTTSQGSEREGWEAWSLPKNIESLREGLLQLWLGNYAGSLLSEKILSEGIASSILSGYDLRLVADLASNAPKESPLPKSRIELYRAMLDRLKGYDGHPMNIEPLKKLAWIMFKECRRKIQESDEKILGAGMIKSLSKENFRIIRIEETVYEFRHDQMRAYLAAAWLIEELPTIKSVQLEIIDSNVFSLSKRDQKELWIFVTPLIQTDADVSTLWRFADDQPEDRGMLISALQVEADIRGITLIRQSGR